MMWKNFCYAYALTWAAFQLPPSSVAMSIDAERSSHHQNIFHVPSFAGIGITSILPAPSEYYSSANDEYYVGTKRGKVKRITLPAIQLRDDASDDEIQVFDIEDVNGKALKPYPIFSLMSVPNVEIMVMICWQVEEIVMSLCGENTNKIILCGEWRINLGHILDG